jgi:hypothetical protein
LREKGSEGEKERGRQQVGNERVKGVGGVDIDGRGSVELSDTDVGGWREPSGFFQRA